MHTYVLGGSRSCSLTLGNIRKYSHSNENLSINEFGICYFSPHGDTLKNCLKTELDILIPVRVAT